jgi:hypothetical protein
MLKHEAANNGVKQRRAPSYAGQHKQSLFSNAAASSLAGQPSVEILSNSDTQSSGSRSALVSPFSSALPESRTHSQELSQEKADEEAALQLFKAAQARKANEP